MKKSLQFDKQLTQWQSNDSLTLKNNKLLNKIHSNSKKNTLTQKSINKRKSRPSSSPVKSIQIKNSINQLRFISHNEGQQSQKIKNRLHYLNVSTQRQQKLVYSAKLKFQKINQIRRQSFTDKSFFSKQRENLLNQNSKTAYLQASKIKSQRYKTSESQKNIILEKQNFAKAVKKERSLNQSFIQEKKQRQKSLLSQKVHKINQQEKIMRQKSANRSTQKIQQGFLNHKKEILVQYQKVQRQLKTNEKMLINFKQKANIICDKKIKNQQELEQFRRFLGLNKSELNCKSPKSPLNDNLKSVRIQKSNNSVEFKESSSSYFGRQSNQKSFYLTNPNPQF